MPTSMSTPPSRVVKYKRDRGVRRIYTPTWAAFVEYAATFLDFTNYIYRGHASSNWLLEPSLDRALKQLGKVGDIKIRDAHLERFRYAARGRRGPTPPRLESDNDWWALGQHHGLATPLLDWTTSPYVAAYFAFAHAAGEPTDRRVVFALSRTATNKANKRLRKASGDLAPTLEFIRPLTDENARLVNQGGLFTRGPDGMHVQEWVQSHLADHDKDVLYRIEIDNSERDAFLRSLNRMNINHLSLFPDLYGAAKHTNFALTIDKY